MKFTAQVDDTFFFTILEEEHDESAKYEVEVNMGAETVEAKLISVGYADAEACRRLLGPEVVARNEERVADAFNVHDAAEDELAQRADYLNDMRNDR